MDGIAISVIIPVYNGEKYLCRSVNSILPQLSKRVELILVDDGSTDGSGRLCDTYAENSEAVQVVHRSNGGISSARNAGIRAARGEYISFVDADDYMSDNAYLQILEVIQKYNPDCIDFGWNYVNPDGEQIGNLHSLEKNCLLDKTVILQTILPPLLNLHEDNAHFIYDYSCNKIFRSDIIRQHQIFFDEGRRIWEDRPFIVHYLKYCNTYYSIDQCYYHYVNVPNSLSRQYSLQFFDIILENYRLYKEWYNDSYDFETQYSQNYWAHAIENMIFRSLEQTESREEIQQNILRTLSNPQVLQWFFKREPTNQFERKVGSLVANNKSEEALFYYKKKAKQIKRGRRLDELFQKGKEAINSVRS